MQQTGHPNSPGPLTRREALGYAQVGAILVLLIAFGITLIQLLVGPSKWVDLGSIETLLDDIAAHQGPVHREIPSNNLTVWVYYEKGQWLVFDGHVPFGDRGCQYQWQPVTGRFEDPCSGARFSRTGEYLDIYTYLRGTAVQDLDRYPVVVQDNHLLIDVSRLIHAEPFVARALTPECCGP